MKNNPFVLPGFGQTGPMGQNPILASMEMMRQAWEGLASSGGMDAATMGRMMSVEEMDKRIADLRAVENWLRMNLSMLSSTIQGLEVQRATVATLKSFVDTGMASMAQPGAEAASATESQASARKASSLDEVLGIRPGQGDTPQQAGQQPLSSAARPSTDEPAAQAPEGAAAQEGASDSGAPSDQGDVMAAAASAAQGWWNLLQQQFQTLAAATAASAEGAMADLAQAGKAAGAAADTGAKGPRKTPAKKAAKSTAARKTAGKTAAKKATKATKSARKTPAARKTAG